MPRVQRRIAAVCGALALSGAAILVARGGGPVTPVSDTAVIESYTLYASRAQLLVGPYSRYGWHHPGPLYFYLLAPVYALAGSSTPGLSAGALLINLASIVILAWVLVATAGGWLTAAVTASMAVYVWRLAPLLVSPWNPLVVVLPLAALTIVAAAVVSGDYGLAPLGVALASFVMQTHLGVVPTALVVSAVLALATRRAAREAIPRSRRAVITAAAVAAVLWAVPLSEQVSASPGNMTAMWRFFSSPDRGHQTMAATYAAWSDMVTGIVRPDFHIAGGSPFRRSRWRPARTVAGCEVVALTAIALIARRRKRRFEAAFASVLLLALAIAFAAVTRIHDDIIDHEVFWISALGALAAATIAAAAAAAWRSEAPKRLGAYTALGACGVAAYVGFGELNAVTKRTIDPDPARRAAAVIGDALERRLRSTGVRPLIQIDQDEWPVAAGALLHLQRSRLAFAVEDDWLVMFTEHARSTGAEAERITITGQRRHYLLTSRREGETIAAADPFYAVALTAKPPQ